MSHEAESAESHGSHDTHVSQILFGADNALMDLHINARESLVGGDPNDYDGFIKDQTKVIAGLAALVLDYKYRGGNVNTEIEDFTALHSARAEKALNEGWVYARFVFFAPGMDRKGPTTLRQLGNSSLFQLESSTTLI